MTCGLEVHGGGGGTMKGYINDKLVTQATDRPEFKGPPVFATATYAAGTHEVIVKVVNMGADPVAATLNLRGAGSVSANGKGIVLVGKPNDVNTVASPMNVAPKEEAMTNAAGTFEREFPAHSLTLLRIGATPE